MTAVSSLNLIISLSSLRQNIVVTRKCLSCQHTAIISFDSIHHILSLCLFPFPVFHAALPLVPAWNTISLSHSSPLFLSPHAPLPVVFSASLSNVSPSVDVDVNRVSTLLSPASLFSSRPLFSPFSSSPPPLSPLSLIQSIYSGSASRFLLSMITSPVNQ